MNLFLPLNWWTGRRTGARPKLLQVPIVSEYHEPQKYRPCCQSRENPHVRSLARTLTGDLARTCTTHTARHTVLYTLCGAVGMYRKSPCLGLKGVGLRIYGFRVEGVRGMRV